MELTNFFAVLAGALAMGGAGAAIAVPLTLAKQTTEPVISENTGELRYTSKKDGYCSGHGEGQCTPVFEVLAPSDESE